MSLKKCRSLLQRSRLDSPHRKRQQDETTAEANGTGLKRRVKSVLVRSSLFVLQTRGHSQSRRKVAGVFQLSEASGRKEIADGTRSEPATLTGTDCRESNATTARRTIQIIENRADTSPQSSRSEIASGLTLQIAVSSASQDSCCCRCGGMRLSHASQATAAWCLHEKPTILLTGVSSSRMTCRTAERYARLKLCLVTSRTAPCCPPLPRFFCGYSVVSHGSVFAKNWGRGPG